MNDKNRAERWPNFFIVGAARAGTTALYGYLQIADIYFPNIKEPRYFLARSETEDIYGRDAVGSKEKYLNLFRDSNAVAIGEATPEYLYHKDVAHKIYGVNPAARIFITLRNPITRAFSHYLLLKRLFNLKHTFKELLQTEYSRLKDAPQPGPFRSPNIIECGFYAEGVKTYLDLFGPDRVRIMIFEQWTKDTLNTLNSITQFLQVNHVFDTVPDITWTNPSNFDDSKALTFAVAKVNDGTSLMGKAYRILPDFAKNALKDSYYKRMSKATSSDKEKMSDHDKAFLRDVYHDDIQRLKEVIGANNIPWREFQ